MGTFFGVVGTVALALVVVAGLWKATSPQKGTGCPCCDKHLADGCEHEAGDKGHTHG